MVCNDLQFSYHVPYLLTTVKLFQLNSYKLEVKTPNSVNSVPECDLKAFKRKS